MNKKEYIQPKAYAITVLTQSILDSSVPIITGTTTEQEAKGGFFTDFEEDE